MHSPFFEVCGPGLDQPGTPGPLDDCSDRLLRILRLLLGALSGQDPLGWVRALGNAEADFDPCGGARIAAGLLAALQAMGRVRPLGFSYRNPHCPCCSKTRTPDEDRFLRALSLVGADDVEAARRQLTILTFSADIEPLLAVLVHLATDLRCLYASR